MYKIILDTNFILSSLQFKIDFFEEIKRISKFSYTLHILQGTIKELENKKSVPEETISADEKNSNKEITENTEKESENEDSLFGRFLKIFSDDSKEKVE